jgi:hypothetical protein
VSLPASALDDEVRLAHLTGLAGSPDGLNVLDVLSAGHGPGLGAAGLGAAGLFTAETVGRLVGAVVTAVLRERFPAGGPFPVDLGDVTAELDTAIIRAWPDLDGDGLVRPAGGQARDDGGRAVPPEPLPAWPPALADGQLCTLFAVDIAGFTRPDRDDDIRLYLHERLYGMLQKAFDGSGIPWTSCWHEDRGDGALVVIPPGVCGVNLVGPLPERLCGLVRRHNHVCRDAAQIQLRVAAHFGLVEHDGHGFVGSDVNLLFRLLDAPPLKRALATSRADLALIVSDYVYRSFVCRHPCLTSPDAFEAVAFQVKQAKFRAWRQLLGTSG